MLFPIIISLSLLVLPAISLPTGAPKCAINATVIQGGHGTPPDNTTGYSLALSSKIIIPGTPINITITNSAGRSDFKGVLIYISGSGNPKKHIGQFQNIDTKFFKFQTEICQNLGFAGDAQSTVTHANPSPKPLNQVSFTWMPLPGDNDPSLGALAVHAVVATDPVPWQVLDVVPVSFDSSSPNNSTLSPTPARMWYKCKPKQKKSP